MYCTSLWQLLESFAKAYSCMDSAVSLRKSSMKCSQCFLNNNHRMLRNLGHQFPYRTHKKMIQLFSIIHTDINDNQATRSDKPF
jgi:hypothetical protein